MNQEAGKTVIEKVINIVPDCSSGAEPAVTIPQLLSVPSRSDEVA
jgi:hypothetical protein